MNKTSCQLAVFDTLGHEPWTWYFRRRSRNLLRKIKRALGRGTMPSPAVSSTTIEMNTGNHTTVLKPGDLVRVHSHEEILLRVNANGNRSGCAFLESMAKYCGRQFRVAKVVTRFFDERSWRMLRCRDVVLLEGVYCDGSGHPDTIGCERMCFFFWRTEWLERAE